MHINRVLIWCIEFLSTLPHVMVNIFVLNHLWDSIKQFYILLKIQIVMSIYGLIISPVERCRKAISASREE